MTVTRRPFGTLPDGQAVEAITLEAGAVSATVLTLGSTLQSVLCPDREGRVADVVLGHDQPEEYLAHTAYFGGTIGRYANRIARGRFTLDGREHRLACNNGPNHLHGGRVGFDKRLWAVDALTEDSVRLTLFSPDGEEGYPGNLTVACHWRLSEDGRLSAELTAESEAPTVVNLTNHAYWNLRGCEGERRAADQTLWLDADAFTPVDETLIPTGELKGVDGGPFDFRRPRLIRDALTEADPQLEVAGGVDHNLVLNGSGMRCVARLDDPESGRRMALSTDAPGLQVYTGNFLDGSIVGKGGKAYPQGFGLCLEPQVFPDAPNRPDFPSARLEPGAVYRRRIEWAFSAT